jgi:putative phosphoesterase
VLIGVVSDTHGYLDDRARSRLRGVDLILHAGDVGGSEVLTGLAAIAPLYAVEGNNDVALGLGLPPRLLLELERHRIQVVHQLPHAAGESEVLIHGHSHRTRNEWVNGSLLLNPGAAGRQGFHAVQSIALLRLEAGSTPEAEIVELGPRLPSAARRPRSSR